MNHATYTYEDVADILNRALEVERGITITTTNKAQATDLVRRMQQWRIIDAKSNFEIYPAGHELHTQSVWHKLRISQRDNIVTVRKYMSILDDFDIQEL